MQECRAVDGRDIERSEVFLAIQARITDGRIRPGERMIEQRLAEELETSRTPVREALVALMALGQVDRTRSGWRTVDHSPQEFRDAFQLRSSLESFAAFQAAGEATDEQIERIREAHERMHEALAKPWSDPLERAETMAALNGRFHQAVVEASNNIRLPRVMDAAVIAPLVFSSFSWYSDEQVQRSDFMHGAICSAIEDRDARRAERLMAEHIVEGWDAIADHFGPELGEGSERWKTATS
jgi:DNA-binding GntR family transcriptional regulator